MLPEDSNSTGTSAAEETAAEGEAEAEPADGAEGAEEEGEAEAEDAEAGGGAGGVARAELRGVRARCPRTPQCAPNPCRSGGACEDHWTSFVCTCPRPHLGDTCQYSTYSRPSSGAKAHRGLL